MPKTEPESLFEAACAEVLALSDVWLTDKGSFRIGTKVFVRFDSNPDRPTFGFKLEATEAKKACAAYACCNPMAFGKMGPKGWVDVTIKNRRQLKVFARLVRQSRELF